MCRAVGGRLDLGRHSPSGPHRTYVRTYQGGRRRQTAPGTVNKCFPSEIKWRLLRILADLFPVLDDLEDPQPRLVERMDAPPWRGYQWPHRDFMLGLRGAADTRVIFVSLQDDPPEKSLQIVPGTSRGYHTSNTWHVVPQKPRRFLLMDGTLIHRGAGGPGKTIFFPFVPENIRTPKCGGTGEYPGPDVC